MNDGQTIPREVVDEDQSGTEATLNSPESAALATIAGTLAELGLAPEGDYAIGEVASEALVALYRQVIALQLELEATKALKEPKAHSGAKPAKLRKINAAAVKDPVEGRTEGERSISAAEALLEEISAAETVEIVISNGSTEIPGLLPVVISGPAWRITVVGLQLTLPELLVHGPAADKPGYPVAGYGLCLDGVLRAYQARSDQLMIAGGARMNVAADIVF